MRRRGVRRPTGPVRGLFHRRIRKVVRRYDGADSTVGEIEYVWGKDISGRRNGAAGIGGLLYLKRNGAIYIPYADAYGNILGYWDANGNLVASYTYNAFGKTIAQEGPMADAFTLRYSTKYWDAEICLCNYGYRYYNGRLFVWQTRDPLSEDGGVNLYLKLDAKTIKALFKDSDREHRKAFLNAKRFSEIEEIPKQGAIL